MALHNPNNDVAEKISRSSAVIDKKNSEFKIKPIKKKHSFGILIPFEVQHQHTFKGPRPDLSKKFQIYYFIFFRF